MKIDRQYFDSATFREKKIYTFEKVEDHIGVYENRNTGDAVYFELDTDERIGFIGQSDNRHNWKAYYNATCSYGWDGKKNTKKELVKKLCTRADYRTAYALLMEEYKRRK